MIRGNVCPGRPASQVVPVKALAKVVGVALGTPWLPMTFHVNPALGDVDDDGAGGSLAPIHFISFQLAYIGAPSAGCSRPLTIAAMMAAGGHDEM